MKVLNDFKCTNCGTQEERLLDNQTVLTECQSCGKLAEKVRHAIRFRLEGTSGDFPTASDMWVKKREQKMREEKKRDLEET